MTAGELVSVSIQQARTPLDLLVVVEPDKVLVIVRDGSTGSPISAPSSTVRGPSRSITVVDRLSRCWGYLRLGAGRELWAVVALEARIWHTAQSAEHAGPSHVDAADLAFDMHADG